MKPAAVWTGVGHVGDLGVPEPEFAGCESSAAPRTRHCGGLKQDYVTLDSPRAIVSDVNAKGGRTYMDDETRNKRLAEIREQLRECK